MHGRLWHDVCDAGVGRVWAQGSHQFGDSFQVHKVSLGKVPGCDARKVAQRPSPRRRVDHAIKVMLGVAPPIVTLLWRSVRMTLTLPKWGLGSPPGFPKNSKFNCRGQNTLPWGVIYIIGKFLKCRCWKWPCMSHSNICNISYGQKKGRESNWQFDFRPL